MRAGRGSPSALIAPSPPRPHVTARLGVPPPGSTTVTTVPRRAAGEGAEVGGEEKAVSSNPGTRGAAEHGRSSLRGAAGGSRGAARPGTAAA